jgi:hypothetical protein
VQVRLNYREPGITEREPGARDNLIEREPNSAMIASPAADNLKPLQLCDVLLSFAVARRWPNTLSNAVEPGWVPTKMGGPSAPDDLMEGCVTQAWLATSEDAPARSTSGYFYHQRPRSPNSLAKDVAIQEQLLTECRRLSGITLE